MLIYLEMCCLKRPFDDHSRPRIRLETEAVLHLLALASEGVRFVRSAALWTRVFDPRLCQGAGPMSVFLEPVELRSRGFEALVNALGWVDAVRFIHQFERSRLDYTAEREALLPDLDGDALVRQMARADDDKQRWPPQRGPL